MGQALYVERETYPSVIPGDEVMAMFRVKGSESAIARFHVRVLATNTTFEARSGQGADVERFATSATLGPFELGAHRTISLPIGADPDANISVLRCLTGRLAVTVVSPHEVQMQFRSRGRTV